MIETLLPPSLIPLLSGRNTCLIPGYVVEGTLAKTLLSEPKEVALTNGTVVPLRMQVRERERKEVGRQIGCR